MNEIELLVRDLYGKYAPNSFSEDKISYVKENYENPEDFVKDFYGKYAPEEYSEDKIQYIRDNYLSKVDDLGKPQAVQDAAPVTAEEEAESTESILEDGLLDSQEIGFNDITQDLISQDEEVVVPKLTELYGKDFEFEEAGALDGVLVKNKKTGNKELFSLDSFTDKGDIESAKEMKLWMKESQNKTKTEVQSDYDTNIKEFKVESKKINKNAEELGKERLALELLIDNKIITSDKDQRLLDYSKKEDDILLSIESLEKSYDNLNKDFDKDIKKAPFVEKKFFSGDEEMSIPIPSPSHMHGSTGTERKITITKGEFGEALAMIDDFTENYSFLPDLGDFIDGMAGAIKTGGYQSDLAVIGNKAYVMAGSMDKEYMQKMADTHEAMSKIPATQESIDYNKQYDKIVEEDGNHLKALLYSAVSNPQEAASVALTSWIGMMNKASLVAATTVIAAGGAYGAAAGTAGGPAAPVTVPAGMVAGAAASLPYAMAVGGVMVETGLTVSDGIRDVIEEENKKRVANGETPVKYDAKSIESVLNNEDSMNKLRIKGATRGLTIGIVDFFASKLGMKVGKKIFGKSGSTFLQFAGTLPIEAGGEFTGESMAMLLTEGKVDWKEATSEVLGSFPGAATDVVATIPGRNKSVYKVNKGFVNKKDFVSMIKEATPLEASEMGTVVIENDEATLKLFNDKLKQAGVIRELKEASPNLSDIQLESISKLQVELNNLNGNNTEVASNRKKGLKNKIKEIESQKDTEPTFTKDDATVEEVVQEKVVEEVEAEDVDKATKEVNDYIDEISIAAEESVFGNKNIVDETLDKINKAEYVNDDEIDNGIDALFDEIERVNSLSISDQAKKNITDKLYNIAETLDNYEFRTKTETRQTTERKTTKVPIQSAAGKRTPEQFFDKTTARVNGKIVKLFTKNGRVEAETKDGTVVIDTPSLDLKENGVKFDNNGVFKTATFTDRLGNEVEFGGSTALDLAIKVRENRIGTVPQAMFENIYEEVETTVEVEVPYTKESKPKETTKAAPKTELTGKSKVITEFSETPKFKKETEKKIEEDTALEAEELSRQMGLDDDAQFQLEADMTSDEKKKVLKEESKELMDEVQPENVETIEDIKKAEPIPVNLKENTEPVKRTGIGRFKLKDIIGKKFNLLMADKLKIQLKDPSKPYNKEKNPYVKMGGNFFPLMEGIFGKVAWASITDAATTKIIKGAMNGDFSAVYNMGDSGIDSNIVMAESLNNGIPENKKNEIFQLIKDRVLKSNASEIKPAQKHFKDASTIMEAFKSLTDEKVDVRAAVINLLVPSESNASSKIELHNKMRELGISIQFLRDENAEQFAKELPDGAITMIVEVQDENGVPVRERKKQLDKDLADNKITKKEYDKAIDDVIESAKMTPEQQTQEGVPTHPNYPMYIRGKAIALMEETASFFNIIPEYINKINERVAGIDKKKTGKVKEGATPLEESIYKQISEAKKDTTNTASKKEIIKKLLKGDIKNIKDVEVKTQTIALLKSALKLNNKSDITTILKKAETPFAKLTQYSGGGIRSASMSSGMTTSTTSYRTVDNLQTQYARFLTRLSRAFPTVDVVLNQDEFDAMLANAQSKKLVLGNQKAYGAVYKGKLYLNPNLPNYNTPIHEFGHIWFNVAKEMRPDLYSKGMELMTKDNPYYQKVVNSKEYGKIIDKMRKDGVSESDIEIYIKEEALATAIGDKGESFASASQDKNFNNWLNELFDFIKKLVGISKITAEQLQNITLDEFLQGVTVDIMSENEAFAGADVKSLGEQLQLMVVPEKSNGRSFTIDDVIKSSERENLTRKETIEVLQELGFTKDEIRGAVKPVKEKARSVASETTGLSTREAFKQGFTEFFDAIQRGKKEARVKAAENLKEKVNKVRESFKKRLQKEKDNKDARAAVVKDIRAIIKDSGISQFSKRTINKIMTNVKNANVNNMQRMVDEVMDVVNRDIDREVKDARYETLKAAREKLSRLGALKELQKPLMEMLSINPDYLSKAALNFYDKVVVNLANVEKKFDNRASREDLKKAADEVIKAFTADSIAAEELAEKTINPNLDLTKTKGENLKQMLKDRLISDSDFELMTRFEDLIGNTKEELALEELEQKAKERRDAAIEDFEAAMDKIPSSLPNLSRDDKEAVRFANGLKMKDLESLTTAQIKKLTRGVEMLQAGFVTTELVQSKVRVEANRNITETLISETEERGKLDKAISKAKVFVTNLFRKRNKKITSIENRIRSTPLTNIDQILNAGAKKFKSTRIYESIFRPVGAAFSKTEVFLKQVKKNLQVAETYLALNGNKRYVQKAKVMIYQIQREYESNPDNNEVSKAIEWIKATLDDPESNISDVEREAIEKIRDEFTVNGQIDSKKILDSLTSKEKKYMAIIDEGYKSVEFMVAADAKMQGKLFVLRENYVHLPRVTKSKNSMSDDLNKISSSFTNPALKNKALTQRDGTAHAISFDPTFNVNAITKKAAISYYMYPAVKKAKITLGGVKKNAQTDFQKETADALENVFDGIVKSQYAHLSADKAFIEKALAFLGRAGYLAQLAGPIKAVVELTTNLTHALFVNPNGLISGFDTLNSNSREIMSKAIGYLPTNQDNRLSGKGVKDSKEVDSRLINDSLNVLEEEEMTSEFRANVNTIFKFAKKPASAIIKFNENLISRPDTIVVRPLFVGVFNKSFENIAQEKPNWEKIANDESYRDKFRDAIKQATEDGDTAVVDNAASNNPFDGIPKNVLDRDASAVKQALQMVDRYMTRFRTFEYYSALKGIQGLMGKGKLTPTQGAMLLAGTVARLSLYKMGIDMVFTLIFSMLGIDEEEDEIDLGKDLTKGVLGAVATLALGRSFGNIAQMPINFGAEWLNKEYGEGITRSGEYNQYKDGLVFSKIPVEVKPQDNMIEKIVTSSLGSYTPMVKTLTRGVKVATKAATLKTEEAKDKNFGELTTRIPFEIAGNLGVIPGYKSLRRIYLKYLYGGIKDSKEKSEPTDTRRRKRDTRIKERRREKRGRRERNTRRN